MAKTTRLPKLPLGPGETANKRWRERNPDKARQACRRNNLRKYGLTPEDYDLMLTAQGAACAICRTRDTAPHPNFHVDHDHQTGRIRGLLCWRCNVRLVSLDDEEWCAKAQEYRHG